MQKKQRIFEMKTISEPWDNFICIFRVFEEREGLKKIFEEMMPKPFQT